MNKKSDEEILLILINEPNTYHSLYAARSSVFSLEKLKELSKSNSYYIREGVAQNINSDENILLKLSEDICIDVRRAVAFNRSSTSMILEKLYEEFPKIVCSNPNCPDYIKILC